jgi:hypothetical protein
MLAALATITLGESVSVILLVIVLCVVLRLGRKP